MKNINDNTKFMINPNFSIHKITDSKYVLTDCKDGDVYEINETTKIIVEKIIQNKSFLQIITELNTISPNNDELTVEFIKDFILTLIDNNICQLM